MIPSAVPLTELTPFLLRQAGLRASLLQTSLGFGADDWDDNRQALALDCLRRLSRFDQSRGNWKGFVRGVVRNHACVLASRQMRLPELCPLEAGCGSEDPVSTDQMVPSLELGIDTRRVLSSLPDELQTFAELLAELPVSAVRQKTGLSLSQVNRRITRIRAAFIAAGITPMSTTTERKADKK